MYCIGILTPRSTLYPTLAFDMLNGLKASLAQLNLGGDFNLITDNIGFGTDEAEIYTKAEKMLLSDNADVVIAFCDSRVAAMLQPLFTAANKLLLVTNLGANLPEGWQAQPTTIIHTLNFCYNSALTGTLAAAGGKAAMATSYYDAGYNQLYSMVTRFQQNAGSILYNHITHLKTDQFTLQTLKEFMAAENGTQNLLCLFCADMAALFYKEIASIQQRQDCQLFVAPMMLEETLIKELNGEVCVNNIQGYTPWMSMLSNANNQRFIKSYKALFNRQPNLFSLLGWDSGLIIEQFYNIFKLNNNTAEAVKAMGKGTALDSPRGWIKLDPLSNHIYGPAWLVKSSNHFNLILEDSNLDMDVEWKRFTEDVGLSATDLYSAWRNTYLCI